VIWLHTIRLTYIKHTASTPGVSSTRPLSARRSLLAVTSAWLLPSESTTSSAKCSYNNVIYCCVLRRASTSIGSTVQDVIFSKSHLAKALLRNITYRLIFLEIEVPVWNSGTKRASGMVHRHIPAHFVHCMVLDRSIFELSCINPLAFRTVQNR
jgi:hypothetical protein